MSLTHQNGLSVYTFNFYYFKFIDALPFVYKINLIKAIQDFHKNKHNFENFKKLSFLKIKPRAIKPMAKVMVDMKSKLVIAFSASSITFFLQRRYLITI